MTVKTIAKKPRKRVQRLEVKSYVCKVCGKTTKVRPHPCSATDGLEPYTCPYCNREVQGLHHVCRRLLEKCLYSCEICGRVTPYPSGVCEPELIH